MNFVKQIWFIGRTLASQAGEAGSTPVICFFLIPASNEPALHHCLPGARILHRGCRLTKEEMSKMKHGKCCLYHNMADNYM